MAKALAELPAGSWTTYGDLAALIGSHPVPVGMRLASVPVVNAHRVLQSEGTLSPGFRWLEPDRNDDPRDLLRQEGVQFDERGHANPAQRITTEELAQLAGLTTDDLAETLPDPNPGQDPALRDRFVEQLAGLQTPSTVHGVLALLEAWAAMDGRLQYGTARETSCFLMARTADHPSGSIWPVVLYPTGKCEVVFQHLASRTPFDDLELRDEFRRRLNQVPGVDLPAAKIELRPGFDLAILAEASRRELLLAELSWFLEQAGDNSADRV
jgi:alkylated DNA nucleotide flippase Atl1